MTQSIDYFFSLGSPWAYVGLDAFVALARSQGAGITPHLIGLIQENGGIYSRDRPAPRKAYWLTDLKRWAVLRGVTLEFAGREALAPVGPAEDLVIAAWLKGEDWLGLTRALQQAFWGRAEDIGSIEVRDRIASGLGLDVAALEAIARTPAVAERRAQSLELGRSAGVFGLPTYLVGQELFWGQDSLPFLEGHLQAQRLVA